MNEKAVEVLVGAAMLGVPQIKGALLDYRGGYCALGLLDEAAGRHGRGLERFFGLTKRVASCPECGATEHTHYKDRKISSEAELIVHLNNDHGWDFLTIARKLGPTAP